MLYVISEDYIYFSISLQEYLPAWPKTLISRLRNDITNRITRTATQKNFKFGRLSLNTLEAFKIILFLYEPMN